jgi:hypothetical protein
MSILAARGETHSILHNPAYRNIVMRYYGASQP